MHSLAIFASGTGTNAHQIIHHFRHHSLVNISLIVCNKPGAGVLNIAANENIDTLLIEKDKFFNGNGYVDELKKKGISFIVLAGFLWKIPGLLIKAYPGNIINIHPALLPKYGGKGMFGMHVHKAALDAGESQSGITIHYVDEIYDHGKIIFQATCVIDAADTPETLAGKVHRLEHDHYPKIIESLLYNNRSC
ncbi:MAG: phosphoribosylglycinamide formyltransferase [Chitinophagaceae bacterium]